MNKIGVSGTASAIAILLVWGLESYGVSVPTEVAQAISALVMSLFTWFGIQNVVAEDSNVKRLPTVKSKKTATQEKGE